MQKINLKNFTIMKKLLYLLFLLIATSAVAQDVIIFKWYASGPIYKCLNIRATVDKEFTIDWGDGTILNYTGQGNNDWLSVCHLYQYSTNPFIVNITALSEDCHFTHLEYSYNQLTNLDVSNCTALTYLDCFDNQLTNLDVSNNTALIHLKCNGNLLTNLDISNCTALTYLDCYLNQLTNLDLSNNTALTYLDCYLNQLTNLDLSNNTALTTLYCIHNYLTNLDVSNCTVLTYLDCPYNQLTNLDLSNNTALTYLDCSLNQLTSLDLSNNTALTVLRCGENQLTNLDLSNNTALTYLGCSYNQLTNLDLSNSTALTNLDCYNNQLTNLDLSNSTALTYLDCYNNQLTNLDVSNNMALTNLSCSNNQLTNLDLSNCTALTYLYCVSNQLTNLDVSNNMALTNLNCSNNQLTHLDVSNNMALTYLYCSYNLLSSINLDFDCVDYISCYNNKLSLSDLYDLKTKVSLCQFGTQTLMPKIVNIGDTLFSEQAVFDGIFTDYTVTQNDIPLSESKYEIINGKLIFNTAGDYTVTMTNEIFENPYVPTKVVIDLTVLNEFFIKENNKSNIQIYPNPTNGQLTIRNEELGITNYNIEIFDITNRKIFTKTITDIEQIIDISHLQSGIYFLKIDKEIVKFIKN